MKLRGLVFLIVVLVFVLSLGMLGCEVEEDIVEPEEHELEYPTSPIMIIAPFPAGGGVDVVARIFASVAGKYTDVPIQVANMAGAGGSEGANYVSRSKPDGYTLIIGSWGSQVTAHMLADVGYTLEDFNHIGMPSLQTLVLAASSKSPFQSFDELVEYAKEYPEEVTYGNPGIGSITHFGVAALQLELGIKFTTVPFDGTPEAILATAGGHVDLVAGSLTALEGAFQGGDLVPLALFSENPTSDIPTVKELGYDFYFPAGRAFGAPADTPQEIIDYLEDLYFKVLADEEYKERIAATGDFVPDDPLGSDEVNELFANLKELLEPVAAEIR